MVAGGAGGAGDAGCVAACCQVLLPQPNAILQIVEIAMPDAITNCQACPGRCTPRLNIGVTHEFNNNEFTNVGSGGLG